MKTPTVADAEKCLEIRIKISEGTHPVQVDHRFICWMVELSPEWFVETKDSIKEIPQCSIF